MLSLDPVETLKLNGQVFIVPNSFLTLPKTTIKLPTKNYFDKNFIDFSKIKNTTHVGFNDEILDNVRFIKVNSFPAIPEHLTAKICVDQAISYSVDGSSLLRLDPDEKLKLDQQDFIVPNSSLTSQKTIIELPTKSYVDSLHEINRNRRDLASVFHDRDNEFDKKN